MVKSAKKSKKSDAHKAPENEAPALQPLDEPGVTDPLSAPAVTNPSFDPENPHNLPVVYEEFNHVEYSSKSAFGPLTPALMKTIMGWTTEEEYVARMLADQPGTKKEEHEFGDVYHCLDNYGRKVRCLNNSGNRSYDHGWGMDLGATVLSGQWAGPLTIPGKHITVNGETIRISRFGRVVSGQHEMTGAILADEALQIMRANDRAKADAKYPFWADKKECVIEVLVVTGMTEDERVLRTVDYVKTRTVADMLFTMDVYRKHKPTARKELTRMLDSALDLLWERTRTMGYKTHPEVVGFLERHRHLLYCVEHLFNVNTPNPTKACGGCGGTGGKAAPCASCNGTGRVPDGGGRKISKLHLSAGNCAALCYLMGSSGPKTDGDAYRNGMPPSEAHLDWSYLDRAYDFWTGLARHPGFQPVRTKLANLTDSTPQDETNQGQGGRVGEKLAVLGHAWDAYKDHDDSTGPAFTDYDLSPTGCLELKYTNRDDRGNLLPDGQVKLLDIADFGGIDCAPIKGRTRADASGPPEESIEYTKEEMEEALEALRKRRTQK